MFDGKTIGVTVPEGFHLTNFRKSYGPGIWFITKFCI